MEQILEIPDFFVPNPVNTSEIDTAQILASLPDSDSITSAGSQLQLFYWSGDKPAFNHYIQMLQVIHFQKIKMMVGDQLL